MRCAPLQIKRVMLSCGHTRLVVFHHDDRWPRDAIHRDRPSRIGLRQPVPQCQIKAVFSCLHMLVTPKLECGTDIPIPRSGPLPRCRRAAFLLRYSRPCASSSHVATSSTPRAVAAADAAVALTSTSTFHCLVGEHRGAPYHNGVQRNVFESAALHAQLVGRAVDRRQRHPQCDPRRSQ